MRLGLYETNVQHGGPSFTSLTAWALASAIVAEAGRLILLVRARFVLAAAVVAAALGLGFGGGV